jgi:hypothetical protein
MGMEHASTLRRAVHGDFVAALDYNDDGRYTNADANTFDRAFNIRFTGFTPTI